MKNCQRVGGNFRIQSALSADPRSSSFFAAEKSGRRVARWIIKWLPLDGGPLAPRLRADFLDLLSIQHPHLCLPARAGVDRESGRAYLLRPFVEGGEIRLALKGRGPKELVAWMLSAAEALAILHRFGHCHGALKSSNIIVPRSSLFSRQPRCPHVVICDPAWSPQEVEDGLSSDLRALAAIFYEAMTGREASDAVPPPSASSADVTTDFERVVLRLLHPDARLRYRSIEALVEDLRRLCPSRPHPVATPALCFLGREQELARVVTRLESTDRPGLLAISGEAGQGKSAFLRRVALEAEVRGLRAVSIQCYPVKSTPLGPVKALLEELIPAGDAGRALRRRFRRIWEAAESPGGGLGTSSSPNQARFAGLLDVLREAAAQVPCVLLIDEVHLADAATLEFFAELAGEMAAAPAKGSARSWPPLIIALSFRAESPFRAALAPLTAAFERYPDETLWLELQQLSSATVLQWREAVLPEREADEFIEGLSKLRGNPLAIREALRRRSDHPGASRIEQDLPAAYESYLKSLDSETAGAIEALAVLARPGSPELLAAVLEAPPAKLRASLEALRHQGTLASHGGLFFFQHGSFLGWLQGTLSDARKRSLHRRAALALETLEKESLEEIARQWLASGDTEKGRSTAFAAARRLSSSHENRRALALYRSALELVPPDRAAQYWELIEETAEAHARTGDYSSAFDVLAKLLPVVQRKHELGRLNGRLGVFSHRAGEIERAALHLERGRQLLEGAVGPPWLRERLRIDSELAEMASNEGDYVQAEAICRKALDRLARSRKSASDRESRREELVLLETLAHLKLRRFEYGEARALFERSLEIGEELDAAPEMCLILNNLGTLHIQENRYRAAIACYERAEKLSAQLGDDQCCAVVLANAAVLRARVGDSRSADEALRRASQHEAASRSIRTKHLFLHCSGIVHLSLGRYPFAIEAFQAAIPLGKDLKDFHLAAFDEVFLGECHLFRGERKAARCALERALRCGPTAPAPIQAMVEARRAVLCAQSADARAAKAFCRSAAEKTPGQAPYTDAWNRIFLGWAWRLLGQKEEARAELEKARNFFAAAGAPLGEVHAQLELAAVDADAGRLEAARSALHAVRKRLVSGKKPLENPMLCARRLLCEALLDLEREPADPESAARSLLEAEGYLVGRRLRDLEVLARRIRRHLRRFPSVLGPPAREAVGERRAGRGILGLVLGSSSAMRRVGRQIEQVAASSLPLLITGETGSGKELIARAVHAASLRREAPFVSLNAAAAPAELLEAELFGYTRGAFSNAVSDRAGLLRDAQTGTFFFDAIGEMPLALQAKLLRVLDRGMVRPLGATDEVHVDVRFIFSTSRDLEAAVKDGGFRQDLFFRIRGLEIAAPPLREHLEDLHALVEHFRGFGSSEGSAPKLEKGALEALAAHSWPGNVRELENVIQRLLLTCGGVVSAEQVRALLDRPSRSLFPPSTLRSAPLEQLQLELEREYLTQLHADRRGNLAAMARTLGITVRALYDRFKRLGIRPSKLRAR